MKSVTTGCKLSNVVFFGPQIQEICQKSAKNNLKIARVFQFSNFFIVSVKTLKFTKFFVDVNISMFFIQDN